MNVGRELRYQRHRRGWTQRELATRSGISQVTICLIEHGKEAPLVATLEKLATVLGMPVSAFFEIPRQNAGQG